jgi:hypothetical protein
MKALHELFKLITVLTLIFICLIGCSKDSDDIYSDDIYPEVFSSENGIMKLKILEGIYNRKDTITDYNPRLISIRDNYIKISGKNRIPPSHRSYFSFSFPSSIIEPGVYSESIDCTLSAAYCPPDPPGTPPILQSWCIPELYEFKSSSSENEITLTITQLNDERIEGTIKVVKTGKTYSDNYTNVETWSKTFIDGYFNVLRE